MKFCPTCQTRYDEEILRFCTKDGTPLVEENPTFSGMPSEESAADDIGEETVIRRNPPPAEEVPAPQPDEENFSNTAQRVVIPVNEFDEPVKEPVRAKPLPPPVTPVKKSNTALVVVATMLGTIIVLGGLGIGWSLLRGDQDEAANRNVNTSAIDSYTNSNFNADTSLANFNANLNANENVNSTANANANTNANLKTPTPTRTPTPTPTRTPEDANTNSNANVNTGNVNATPRPSASPTASPGQTARPSPSPTNQNVNVGVMNSRAINLPKPAYPQTAKDANAAGQVTVQISVDEVGNVLSARAVSGHPLLRTSAENAARQSRFNPVKVDNQAVRANGLIVYNFINQ